MAAATGSVDPSHRTFVYIGYLIWFYRLSAVVPNCTMHPSQSTGAGFTPASGGGVSSLSSLSSSPAEPVQRPSKRPTVQAAACITSARPQPSKHTEYHTLRQQQQ